MSPQAEHPADSAGVPWEGRSFEPNPHSGDDGSADPALLAALTAFHAGQGDAVAVVEAYRTARLLIPLVAETGSAGQALEPEVGPYGLPVDKTQELSIDSSCVLSTGSPYGPTSGSSAWPALPVSATSGISSRAVR